MPKKRFSGEQIVVLLRQIEVLMSQGKTPAVACREAGISQQSYYRWRKEYGGLDVDQAKRMKDLERENVRLKRLVADLSLEKQILKMLRRETCRPRTAPAGGSGHPGEVWALRTPRLPDRRPAPRHATLHGHCPS
jgi:putative transposase